MGPPASHRITRVRWYSGTGCLLFAFAYAALTPSGSAFQRSSADYSAMTCAGPQPRGPVSPRFGLFPVRSPLLGKSLVIFSSSGYLDVSVHRVPLIRLFCSPYDAVACGFPHSDIRGSGLICSSPRLFAACHVLLRLLMPRHPPYAL